MNNVKKYTQQTKVYTNDALRTCDAIIRQIEDRPKWDAYHNAVKNGSSKPWLFL